MTHCSGERKPLAVLIQKYVDNPSRSRLVSEKLTNTVHRPILVQTGPTTEQVEAVRVRKQLPDELGDPSDRYTIVLTESVSQVEDWDF